MLVSFGVGFALIFCPLVAMALLPHDVTLQIAEDVVLHDWRFLLMIFSLPGWIALVSISLVPETPYFLLSVGRVDAAKDALKWVAKMNGKGKVWDEMKINLTPETRNTLMEGMSACKELLYEAVRLFRPPYAARFIGCLLILFGIFFR